MKNKKIITITDNQQPNIEYHFASDSEKEIRSAIESVSSVNKLMKEHKTIIVPKRDSFEKDTIIEIRNSKIYTYNWVGVVSPPINNQRIEITSRFDTGKKQYFLLYLLSSVYGVNIFNIDINSEEESNYIIILIILFLNKIVEAYSDGLYKEYDRIEYNDYNFKGALDINRHIKLNTPFMGKTAYKVREYTYDNEILCLMRQVMDYIKCNHCEVWGEYLNNEPILNEIVEVIYNATTSFKMNFNYADTIKCRREITHPMFQNYEDARKLAIMILNESGQNIFDNSKELSFSLLVDEKGDEHKRRNIFDAKYKFWDWDKNDDIHQLLSYLLISGGNKCGIIYPDNKPKTWSYKEIHSYEKFYGNEYPKIYKMPMYIHHSDNIGYVEYCRLMEESIKKWKDNLQNSVCKI